MKIAAIIFIYANNILYRESIRYMKKLQIKSERNLISLLILIVSQSFEKVRSILVT